MKIRTLVAVTVLSSLAVCSSLASAQTRASRRAADDDPDMKELASYTLTMDALNKVDRVNRDVFTAMQSDPKYAEQMKIAKELADLQKKDEPTEAEQKRIDQLEKRQSELEEQDKDDDTDAKTLADMEKKLNSIPQMAAALRKEGMSGREYATFTMAIMQAGFAAAIQKQMAKSGKPSPLPEGINPANVKFVQEHEADLKRLEDAYSAMNGVRK